MDGVIINKIEGVYHKSSKKKSFMNDEIINAPSVCPEIRLLRFMGKYGLLKCMLKISGYGS